MRFLRWLGRLVGVATFTAVEAVSLAIWLALVRFEPLGSASEVVGVSVLAGGLLLEGLLTHVTVNGRDGAIPAAAIAAFSATETALWILWLALVEGIGGLAGFAAAGVALALLLVPQHSVEDNVLRGRRAISRLFHPGTVTLSVLESLGATAWLVLVTGFGSAAALVHGTGVTREIPLAGTGLAIPTLEVVGFVVLTVSLFFEHVAGIRLALRPEPTAEESGIGRTGVGPITFHQE